MMENIQHITNYIARLYSIGADYEITGFEPEIERARAYNSQPSTSWMIGKEGYQEHTDLKYLRSCLYAREVLEDKIKELTLMQQAVYKLFVGSKQ